MGRVLRRGRASSPPRRWPPSAASASSPRARARARPPRRAARVAAIIYAYTIIQGSTVARYRAQPVA
jgi:hypothetical protein